MDGPLAFLIGFRLTDREASRAIFGGFDIFHLKGSDFPHPQQGVTHHGHDCGIPEPRERLAAVGGDSSHGVGLVPVDPGNLPPAPLASFPADSGKDSLAHGAYRRLLSYDAGLEADGGDHLGSYGWRLPGLMERREIGGQRFNKGLPHETERIVR